MNNVAIVIAGFPRTFETTSKLFFKNFIFNNINEIDFFLHFYNEGNFNKVIEIYNPIDWICEDSSISNNEFKKKSYINSQFPQINNYKSRIYNQFKNNYIAFNLIPKNKYNVVIKTRYDLLLNEPFDFSTLDMSLLNIPIGEDHGGLNDRFCISSYDNMKVYFDFYTYISDLNNAGIKFHPESLLKEYLNLSGNKVNRFSCDTNYILR